MRESPVPVYAIKESPRQGGEPRMHIVSRPHVLDPDGRPQLRAYENWHEREIAQHSAHQGIKAPPRWRHKDSMFFGETFPRWEQFQIMRTESIHDFPPAMRELTLPRVDHASVWDFFLAIGWDRKKKRYV